MQQFLKPNWVGGIDIDGLINWRSVFNYGREHHFLSGVTIKIIMDQR
jgi:hypothetical protein